MKHLPHRVTTRTGQKYKTSHGLNSCRRSPVIDVYDRHGNQSRIFTASITKHSAGSLTDPAKNKPEPKPANPCLACGHDGPTVQYSNEWPQCGNCGAV